MRPAIIFLLLLSFFLCSAISHDTGYKHHHGHQQHDRNQNQHLSYRNHTGHHEHHNGHHRGHHNNPTVDEGQGDLVKEQGQIDSSEEAWFSAVSFTRIFEVAFDPETFEIVWIRIWSVTEYLPFSQPDQQTQAEIPDASSNEDTHETRQDGIAHNRENPHHRNRENTRHNSEDLKQIKPKIGCAQLTGEDQIKCLQNEAQELPLPLPQENVDPSKTKCQSSLLYMISSFLARFVFVLAFTVLLISITKIACQILRSFGIACDDDSDDEEDANDEESMQKECQHAKSPSLAVDFFPLSGQGKNTAEAIL